MAMFGESSPTGGTGTGPRQRSGRALRASGPNLTAHPSFQVTCHVDRIHRGPNRLGPGHTSRCVELRIGRRIPDREWRGPLLSLIRCCIAVDP